jgi:hypothetical protein
VLPKRPELLRMLVPLMERVVQRMCLLVHLLRSPMARLTKHLMDHLPIPRVAGPRILLVSHKGFEAQVLVVHNIIATIIQLCGMRKQA